jgi:hypothetical protein
MNLPSRWCTKREPLRRFEREDPGDREEHEAGAVAGHPARRQRRGSRRAAREQTIDAQRDSIRRERLHQVIHGAEVEPGDRMIGHRGRDHDQRRLRLTLTDGAKFEYGLGLFLGNLGGHRMIFHGGGVNGFVSTLAYFPDDDVYIAVLVNTDGSFADDLGEAIARQVLAVPRAKVTPAQLSDDAIVGRYEAVGVAIALIIERGADGKVVAHKDGGEPRPLVREADGSFTIPGRGTLTFRTEADRVTGFTYVQGGMTFEARRVP